MPVENKTKELLRTINAKAAHLLGEGRLAYDEIGRRCRCSLSTVDGIARRNGLRRKGRKMAMSSSGSAAARGLGTSGSPELPLRSSLLILFEHCKRP